MMPLLKKCLRHARGTKFEPFVNSRLATGRCTSSAKLSARFLLGLVFCCCCSINFSRTGGAQTLQPVCPALLLSPTPSLRRTLQPLTSFPTQCRCRCARHAATFGSSSHPWTLADGAWRQQRGQARSSGVVMQASGGWEDYLASGDRTSNGDGRQRPGWSTTIPIKGERKRRWGTHRKTTIPRRPLVPRYSCGSGRQRSMEQPHQ